MNASNGCKQCPLQRDPYSGWGRLDLARAIASLEGVLPSPDRLEPNDDAGKNAMRLSRKVTSVKATLDFWDDQNDVYAVRMKRRQRLTVRLIGSTASDLNLAIWRPGTKRIDQFRAPAATSAKPGSREYLSYRVGRAGLYYVQVKISQPGSAVYQLRLIR